MGNNQIKSLVGLAFSVIELVASLAHGFNFGVIGKVVQIAKEIGPGLAAAPQALAQYVAMSDADALDLENWVVSEFDIDDNNVEAAIEGALKVAIELHGLIKFLVPKAVA